MKITASQRKALILIHENPRNVAAYQHYGPAAKMLKIHGNTENGLIDRGLAIAPATDIELYRDGDYVTMLRYWELTDLGREAIGVEADVAEESPASPQVHPLTGMTTTELRDYIAENVDAATVARINSGDMHDLINDAQRWGHIADDKFRERINRYMS